MDDCLYIDVLSDAVVPYDVHEHQEVGQHGETDCADEELRSGRMRPICLGSMAVHTLQNIVLVFIAVF